MLGSMSLSSATGHCSTPLATGSKLAVRREGQVVSLESTLEIKTRVSHKSLPIEEVAAQLWVSQTPKLVRAYHRNGTFEDPRVEDVAGVVKKWESDHQPHLRKLVALIGRILSVVKEWAGARNATLKYNAAGDKLVILTADEKKKLLPDDLYGMWVDAGNLCADVREESKNTDKSAVESKTQTPVHADTPFFEVINYSVVNGYRHFFRRMPLSLSQYHVLHDSLELLGIDVLQNQTISNIMHDFRAAKDDYDSGERRQIRGPKSVARDAAFRLIYMFLHGELDPTVGDKNQAFNATLFVLSHWSIFRYKTRKIVKAAFDERFDVSAKQAAAFAKWMPILLDGRGASDGDVTTEEDNFDDSSDSSLSEIKVCD